MGPIRRTSVGMALALLLGCSPSDGAERVTGPSGFTFTPGCNGFRDFEVTLIPTVTFSWNDQNSKPRPVSTIWVDRCSGGDCATGFHPVWSVGFSMDNQVMPPVVFGTSQGSVLSSTPREPIVADSTYRFTIKILRGNPFMNENAYLWLERIVIPMAEG